MTAGAVPDDREGASSTRDDPGAARAAHLAPRPTGEGRDTEVAPAEVEAEPAERDGHAPRHLAAGRSPVPPAPAPGGGSSESSEPEVGPSQPVDGSSPERARAGRHPRPTSGRGRAAARRRARLAAPRVVPGAVEAVEVPAARGPVRRRRPRAELVRRRRTAVLAGIAALTVAGAGLAFAGLSAVRTSTAGRYEQAAGPDDPGYQAHVVPTPTMGVLHRGADGTLVGASLLALEPGDDGGSVIVVPPASIVPGASGETTIAAIYRDQGAAAAAQALGVAVTVGVSEYVEVDDAQWARLVGRVGPVEVSIDGAVLDWPAGPVTLEPAEVGRFLSARADDETDLDRLDRQQLFWNAWLPLVGRGGTSALPGEVGTGIGRFVRGVAQGGGSAAALPVGRDDGDDPVRFRTDQGRVGEFISRTVPYPTAAEPGGRIRVRLLNGTRDASLTSLAAQALVAGGAQISIAGNASTLDVAETSLVYTGADRALLAEWLQRNLGGGRVEEALTGQDGQVPSDDEIDVTVILGDDAGDLIER